MTILPAVVTITDLPLATTLSSAAVFEAVQTTNGVIESVQVALTQIMTASLGALPAGGNTGQLLGKASGTDYDTGWVDASAFLAANATSGLVVAGSTTLALSLASVAGLSVLGVAGTSTAIPLPVTAAAGAQVLRANDAGTGVGFGAINLASSAAVTGVLGVPLGGSGTTAFSARAVVLAGTTATSALQNAAVSTAGNILIDQGTAANPTFRVVGGDLTMSTAGTATIATNVVSYAKIQQGTGLAVLGFATTAASNITTVVASAANQVLGVNSQGTGLAFGLPAQVLLNTLSPNGVATIGDTTSFTTTFASYLLTFHGVIPSNVTAQLQVQVATTGTSFLTSGYTSSVSLVSFGISTVAIDSGSNTAVMLSGTRATTCVSSTAGVGVNGFVRVMNPAGSTAVKMWIGELAYYNNGAANTVIATPYGFLNSTAALSGFQIAFSPGNIATGTIKVYGLT